MSEIPCRRMWGKKPGQSGEPKPISKSEGMIMYQDKSLVCRDCGAEFVFTAGEQEFFAEKGFLNDPVRCRDCRVNKKQARREKVSYPTVCANCGVQTEVPFVPKNDKPVYCSDCFAAMRQG